MKSYNNKIVENDGVENADDCSPNTYWKGSKKMGNGLNAWLNVMSFGIGCWTAFPGVKV